MDLLQKKYCKHLSHRLFSTFVRRYVMANDVFLVYYVASDSVRRGTGAPPGITFDRFVRACVVIKQITETFQKLDTDRDGWVQINYEQFMHTVLSLP